MAKAPKPYKATPEELKAIEEAIRDTAKSGDLPAFYRQEAVLFRKLAQEPHNKPIRAQIEGLVRQFDELAEKAEHELNLIPIRRNPG